MKLNNDTISVRVIYAVLFRVNCTFFPVHKTLNETCVEEGFNIEVPSSDRKLCVGTYFKS